MSWIVTAAHIYKQILMLNNISVISVQKGKLENSDIFSSGRGWVVHFTQNLPHNFDQLKGSSQNRMKIFYLYNVKIRGREGV